MERFIIGTGRCGSTLLSNMLSLHPDLLMVSEFMKGFDPGVDGDGASISGEEFAERLAAPYILVDLPVRRGFVPPEVLSGLGATDLASVSIPKLFISTLPTLTNEPEVLFHESIVAVRSFPMQTLAKHYLMYFEWLQEKFGRRMWVERSGASIEIMPELRSMYPKGKYLHIHRDGPEAALSMREHAYFRLYVSLYFNPVTREELERTEITGKAIAKDDPLIWRMTDGLPSYEQFGEFWSHQVAAGVREFMAMNSDQLLDIRFENLAAKPRMVLRIIADFFELPQSESWLIDAEKMINKSSKVRVAELSKGDQIALKRGCLIGQHLLGRTQWPGVDSSVNLLNQMVDEYKEKHPGA